MITGKLYDVLKWVALIVVPAFATFVLACSLALGWDDGNVVATIITAFGAFLGSILQVSSEKFKSYLKTDEAFDGYVQPNDVDPDTGIPSMAFTVSRHPVDFLNRDEVRLKVGAPPVVPVVRQPLPDAEVELAPGKHDGDIHS